MGSGEIVGKGSALEEGAYALLCGLLYGGTSVVVGHPFDTVKTKMQALPEYRSLGMLRTFKAIAAQDGIRGLYAGFLPPLCGSLAFRSIQFASYGVVFAALKDTALEEYKFAGIEARVVAGGIVSGISRSLIESPLDLMKTRRQTGGTWRSQMGTAATLRELSTGITATVARNVALLTSFFIIADGLLRWLPQLMSVNPFIRGGISSTAAWTVIWPLDVVKTRAQATGQVTLSVRSRLALAAREGALYRGYLPGATRSFLANGVSFFAYQFGQDLRHKHFATKAAIEKSSN